MTTIDFDPDGLRDKYRSERDKRVRADGNEQYVEITGQFAHYLDSIYDISGALDAEAVAQFAIVAKKSLTPLTSFNGQPIGKEHAVWKAFKNSKGDGNITAAEAHEYASFVASKRVADLFYDASRKRLLFHQLRLIAPFGAAWEDTIRKWGQIRAA